MKQLLKQAPLIISSTLFVPVKAQDQKSIKEAIEATPSAKTVSLNCDPLDFEKCNYIPNGSFEARSDNTYQVDSGPCTTYTWVADNTGYGIPACTQFSPSTSSNNYTQMSMGLCSNYWVDHISNLDKNGISYSRLPISKQ